MSNLLLYVKISNECILPKGKFMCYRFFATYVILSWVKSAQKRVSFLQKNFWIAISEMEVMEGGSRYFKDR